MTVYYVTSRDFQHLIEADNPHDACVAAIRAAAPMPSRIGEITVQLGREIHVSQIRFGDREAGVFETSHIMTSLMLADEIS